VQTSYQEQNNFRNAHIDTDNKENIHQWTSPLLIRQSDPRLILSTLSSGPQLYLVGLLCLNYLSCLLNIPHWNTLKYTDIGDCIFKMWSSSVHGYRNSCGFRSACGHHIFI